MRLQFAISHPTFGQLILKIVKFILQLFVLGLLSIDEFFKFGVFQRQKVIFLVQTRVQSMKILVFIDELSVPIFDLLIQSRNGTDFITFFNLFLFLFFLFICFFFFVILRRFFFADIAIRRVKR